LIGILAFFLGDSLPSLVIGALIFGISVAGGDIAWSLWVTKVAPADKVADYMAVHTLLTGVRGVLAPFLAFQLVQSFHPATLAWGCAGLIAIASAMLIPEVRSVWRRRAATPLTPTGEER
ncbi:MAG: MFS transporter, partial [Verrucomicrobiia bacterium]